MLIFNRDAFLVHNGIKSVVQRKKLVSNKMSYGALCLQTELESFSFKMSRMRVF